MEFHQKIQQLRLKSGLTQEQLAELLFVSRVTVSKWESGRGYPNIESLKLLAKVLGVTIDDLLSTDELLLMGEKQMERVTGDVKTLVFGVLDFMQALLLVLPIFAEFRGGRFESLTLPALNTGSRWITVVSYLVVVGNALFGVLELALQNLQARVWTRLRMPVSATLTVIGIFFFLMTRQLYACAFMLCILILKGILLVKKA